MHPFRSFIQQKMDGRGWTRSDLARQSGLSTQHVSKLLSDDRDRLDRMPDHSTIAALSKAFDVAEDVVLLEAARAYGVPIDAPVETARASAVSDDELLLELGARLRQRSGAGVPEPTLDIDAMEHRALTDIIDLMRRLRADANESDATERPGLAAAQRFLADHLERGLDATISTITDPVRHEQHA